MNKKWIMFLCHCGFNICWGSWSARVAALHISMWPPEVSRGRAINIRSYIRSPRPYHFHTDGTCPPLVYTTKRDAAEPSRFSVHCTCEWRGELYLLWRTWRGVLWSDARALYGTISVHNKTAASVKKTPDTLQHAWGMQEILFDASQAGMQWDFSHITSAEAEMPLRPARLYGYARAHARGEPLSKYCVRPRWVCYPADNEAVRCCSWKALWGNVWALSQCEREKEGWLQWVLHHQSPFM